jgi:hypothetical protein
MGALSQQQVLQDLYFAASSMLVCGVLAHLLQCTTALAAAAAAAAADASNIAGAMYGTYGAFKHRVSFEAAATRATACASADSEDVQQHCWAPGAADRVIQHTAASWCCCSSLATYTQS